MKKFSKNRYKSYSEKKSQKKRYRTYFTRIMIFLVIYSFFTTFIATTIKINSESMMPSLENGNSVIFIPSNKFNFFSRKDGVVKFKRGDIVLASTNYSEETTLLDKILDPVVRIFTLQKKSIIYSNKNFKGQAEIFRIVGLPDDSIKISDNIIYVKKKDEEFFLSEFEVSSVDYDVIKGEYSSHWNDEFPFSKESSTVTVPKDCYFLISDNRIIFNDSRIFGVVNSEDIKGSIKLKYWPLNEFTIF